MPAPAAWRRLIAGAIDLALVYVYIGVLVLASVALDAAIPFHEAMERSYPLRHGVAFTTLTLPVVGYFVWGESGRRQATVGKRAMGLCVADGSGAPASTRAVLVRNIIKFLPWEMAHTHLQLFPEFIRTGELSVVGAWLGLGLPMALALLYVLLVGIRDGRTVYEWVSGTRTIAGAAPRPSTSAGRRVRDGDDAGGSNRAG